MELMSGFILAVLAIIGAALSRQLADEFKAWMPWVIQRLLKHAVGRLDANQRERFEEEWLSHVDELPGEVGKLVAALGFLRASRRMAPARRQHPVRRKSENETQILPETNHVAEAIDIPSELGGSWAAFCEHRGCPDGALAYSPAEVSRALSVIKRLWPEKFAQTAHQSAQGTATVVPEIETGLLLAACETARYFGGMLERLKSGQRSAYSELVLVAALRRLGYDPQFEGAGRGKPDAQCSVEDAPISFEVYAPSRSYASQEKQKVVRQLREAVGRGVSKCRVEIEILEAFCENDICQAVQAIRSAVPGTWSYVGDWARFWRIDRGQDLPPSFDGDGARLIIGSDVATQGESTGVIVRWEEDDMRAERSLQEKGRQVADGAANVVVINVCAVGGIVEWPEQIAKLRGSDYEKIGAVAFFDQGSFGPPEAIRRRWRLVVNLRAHIAVPEVLISGLESLDDVSHLGLPPKPRLFMS